MEPAGLMQAARVLSSCILVLTALAIGAVLSYLRAVLIPFTLAVFLSYLLEPLVETIIWLIGGCGGRVCCTADDESRAVPRGDRYPDATRDSERAGLLAAGGQTASAEDDGGSGRMPHGAPPPSPADAELGGLFVSPQQAGPDRISGLEAAMEEDAHPPSPFVPPSPLAKKKKKVGGRHVSINAADRRSVSSGSSGAQRSSSSVVAARTGCGRQTIRTVAVLLAVLLAVAFLTAVVLVIEGEVEHLVQRLQTYHDELDKLDKKVTKLVTTYTGLKSLNAAWELIKRSVSSNSSTIAAFAGTISDVLFGAVLTFVLLLFVMLSAPASSSHRAVSPRRMEFNVQIHEQVRRYIRLKTLVCMSLGAGMTVFLWVMGVELPLAFGLLAWLVNYVPNFGAVVASASPLPVAILTPTMSSTSVIICLAVPIAMHVAVANLVEPKLYSANLDLHPATILLSVCAWGVLWGVPGMVISVPMTGACKLALAYQRNSDALGLYKWFDEAMVGRLLG